jgi:pteridine reductase
MAPPSTDSRPVVLVTGAARRVGAAIVRHLHATGCDIALHFHRSHDEARALAEALNAQRADSALAVAADLADVAACASLVERAVAHFGRLDGLVNNASAFYPTPLGRITAAQWDELFAANARAPLFLAQAAAGPLRDRSGAIVNLADIYAERPLREHVVYGMAKAALVMATRALALELAPEVRVNAIAPGAILWPDAGKPDDDVRALLARVPLARQGEAEDIAEAVRWLLFDARYTTGQVLRVDGGRLLAP